MQVEKFYKIISKFGVNRSAMLFKTAVALLIDEYPKMKKTSLALHFLKKNMRTIQEVCKGNASKG